MVVIAAIFARKVDSRRYFFPRSAVTLDNSPEISCKELARIDCIREYLQESYKNGVVLQVQKNHASFLKESCKETPDFLTE